MIINIILGVVCVFAGLLAVGAIFVPKLRAGWGSNGRIICVGLAVYSITFGLLWIFPADSPWRAVLYSLVGLSFLCLVACSFLKYKKAKGRGKV